MKNVDADKPKKTSFDGIFVACLITGLIAVSMVDVWLCSVALLHRFPYLFDEKPDDVSIGLFLLMTLGLLLLYASCVILPTAVGIRLYGAYFARGCTVRVSAVILSVRRMAAHSTRNESVSYLPTYSYTLNGQTVKVEDGLGSSDADAYHVGDRQEMLVNPDNPNRYLIEGRTDRRAANILMQGLILLICGVLCFVPALL